MKARIIAALIGTAWVAFVVAGFAILADYERTPGAAATPPERWPDASALARAGDRPTLLLVAHPHCPCTRATMSELAVILSDAERRPDTHVVFVVPADARPGWEESGTWHRAQELGAHVHVDRGGVEAARFDAATSGQTLLYREDGTLVFRGGITAARGHAGDNVGRRAVLALLRHDAAGTEMTQVYGCPVDDEEGGGSAWNR